MGQENLTASLSIDLHWRLGYLKFKIFQILYLECLALWFLLAKHLSNFEVFETNPFKNFKTFLNLTSGGDRTRNFSIVNQPLYLHTRVANVMNQKLSHFKKCSPNWFHLASNHWVWYWESSTLTTVPRRHAINWGCTFAIL